MIEFEIPIHLPVPCPRCFVPRAWLEWERNAIGFRREGDSFKATLWFCCPGCGAEVSAFALKSLRDQKKVPVPPGLPAGWQACLPQSRQAGGSGG